MDAPSQMQIGAIAKETGVSIDTIRFYEKQGLLKQQLRTQGGFRLFLEADIERLKFIRNAQELGFSLVEIRELLALQGEHVAACCHVQELLERKLAVVREKLKELAKLEQNLNSSLIKCRKQAGKGEDAHTESCPVLNGMQQLAHRRTKA